VADKETVVWDYYFQFCPKVIVCKKVNTCKNHIIS